MPVSLGRRVVRCTRLIPPTITTALTSAPSVRSNPHIAARAMPGSTPWARASREEGQAAHDDPGADQRRRRRGEQTAEQRPLREVRGERVGEEVDGSRQGLGDQLGVGAHHRRRRCRRPSRARRGSRCTARRPGRRSPTSSARASASSADCVVSAKIAGTPASRTVAASRSRSPAEAGRPWSATGSRRRAPRIGTDRRSSRATSWLVTSTRRSARDRRQRARPSRRRAPSSWIVASVDLSGERVGVDAVDARPVAPPDLDDAGHALRVRPDVGIAGVDRRPERRRRTAGAPVATASSITSAMPCLEPGAVDHQQVGVFHRLRLRADGSNSCGSAPNGITTSTSASSPTSSPHDLSEDVGGHHDRRPCGFRRIAAPAPDERRRPPPPPGGKQE